MTETVEKFPIKVKSPFRKKLHVGRAYIDVGVFKHWTHYVRVHLHDSSGTQVIGWYTDHVPTKEQVENGILEYLYGDPPQSPTDRATESLSHSPSNRSD